MRSITFPTAGADATGLVAGEGMSGLIVVHEWWGLNGTIEAMTERLAGAGFAALAVDLYGGRVTAHAGEAMALSNELQTARALEIIAGGARHLAARGGRVGVTGFCLGGAMSLAAACQLPEIAAAVPFYGTPRDEFLGFGPSTPPIQGHYALRDTFVSTDRVRAIHDKAQAAGARFELHFYEADHAFMREGDPAAYHEPSASLAWSRMMTFLREHLSAS